MTNALVALGLKLVDSNNAPTGVVMADVNGDGIADLVQAQDGGTNAIHLAAGPFPDLLDHVVSALGETTDISYAPSSTFDNTGGDTIQDLPLVLQVATSLTRGDGRGNSFLSSFTYAGGLQLDRKLRGFANSTIVDPRGVTQRLHFFQDEARIAQIASGETLDTLGHTRSSKTSTYQLVTPVAGVTQALLVQLDEETIDPAESTHPAGSLHTRTRTVYDQFLNVIEVDKDGDVNVTGDEGRTVIQHVQNLALNIVDPVSRLSTYDAAGNLVSRTITYYDGLPEGNVTAGNPTRQVESVEIGGATVTRPTSFDQYGNVLKTGDGANHFTTFAYDTTTHAFRTKLTDPNGRTIQSSYDLRFGVATSEVDFNGHTQTRALDTFGRLVRESLPGDEASPFGTQTITYSALGDPATQSIRIDATTTAGGSDAFATKTFYDGFAQAYRIEAPGEGGQVVVQTTEFDDAGNATTVSRPFFSTATPALTTYDRDALRRLIAVTEPDGIPHTITFYGTTTDVVDRRGNLARFIRDAYGKVVEEHQFVSGVDHVTRYTYDSVGNPTAITDALGEVTKITYDALGRRTSIIDPSAGKFTYRYDSGGNLSAQVDANGKETTFTYDAARQLVRKQLPDGRVIRLEYDLSKSTNTIGRVARVHDDVGLLEVEYDVRGNVAIHRRHIDDMVYLTGYGYDSMQRLRRVVYPDGYVLNYTYNAAGYVDRIVDGKSNTIVANVDYNASGAITNIQMGNGTVTQRTYDVLSRLNRLTTSNGAGTLIQDRQHTYDPIGNVTAMTDLAFGRSQTFTYDEKSRITSAVGVYGSENYTYDAIGNLLKKGSMLMGYDPLHPQQVICGIDVAAARVVAGPSAGKGDIDGDDDRQFGVCVGLLKKRALSTSDRNALNAFGNLPHPDRFESGTTFVASSDQRGNMIHKNDTDYIYDSENHLLRVLVDGKVIEENVYDAGGNRVLRKANGDKGSSSNATVFIDGIFEMNAVDAFRHVTIGHMLLASVRSSADSVCLVSNVDPKAFAETSIQQAPSRGCSCNTSGLPLRGSLLVLGLGAVVALVASVRTVRGRRFWRKTRRVGRGVADEACRRPTRWLLALLLIPTYLMYAGSIQAAPSAGSLAKPSLEFFYYHLDHVGNVEAITNHKAEVVKRLQYKPFGEQFVDHVAPHQSGFLDTTDVHAQALDRSFNGHEFDSASGLYYFGARHYNPVLGRFLTADTKVIDPTNPQLLHRYAFNLNNPIRYADLTGHGFWDVVLGIVVAVLIIAAVVVVTIGTAGVGAAVFGVAVGILIGAGVGLAVGVALAYAKYGNLTSLASLRLILATTFAGELVGASVGFIVGSGGLSAAFSANSIANWATHDLIANVLLGAAAGAIGAEAGANPMSPDYGLEIFLGTAIGIGIGVIAAVGDPLGNIVEPGWGKIIQALFSIYGATQAFTSANAYVCKQARSPCFQDPGIQPTTDISTGSSQLTAESKLGVPAWSFDGTSLGAEAFSFINREHLDLYPLTP